MKSQRSKEEEATSQTEDCKESPDLQKWQLEQWNSEWADVEREDWDVGQCSN